MVTMSTNDYLKKLNEVYPYTEKTDIKNKDFKEKIISILENNNISYFDFIDNLYKIYHIQQLLLNVSFLKDINKIKLLMLI